MSQRIRTITREHNPFGRTQLAIDGHAQARYRDLPSSLVAMLRSHATQRPDTEAVVECGGQRLTYAELWREATHLAGQLRAQGLADGDRVAILYPAGLAWVLAFWGVVFAGGIAVAPNTRLTEAEIEHVIEDSGAAIRLAPGVTLPPAPALEPAERKLDDVVALFYTSGTTGHSPRACLSPRKA